jgi:hypothetical protein
VIYEAELESKKNGRCGEIILGDKIMFCNLPLCRRIRRSTSFMAREEEGAMIYRVVMNH